MSKPMRSEGDAPNARERQREETRRAILASALEVFAEKGFEGAAMREIAARAGVNHAMLAYYFATKDGLWRAAADFLFKRFGEEVSFAARRIEAEFGGDTRAWAEGCIRDYVRYCARHPEHARLLIQETVREGDRLTWLSERYGRLHRRGAEVFVQRLIAAGIIPAVEVAPLIYIVVGAAQQFHALAPEVRAVWDVDPGDEAMVEAHARTLTTLLFRGA